MPANRHADSMYRQPRFGWGMLLVVLIYGVVMYLVADLVGILIQRWVTGGSERLAGMSDLTEVCRRLWIDGVCYAGLVWSTWIGLGIARAPWREIAIGGAMAACFYLLREQVTMGPRPLLATVIGIALGTAAWFRIARVPHWQFDITPPPPAGRFRLLDLIVLTTASAGLFALARICVPPSPDVLGRQYWMIAAAGWTGLVWIAGLVFLSSLHRHWWMVIVLASSSIVLVAAMAISLAWSERVIANSPNALETSVVCYLTIVMAFYLTCGVLGLITRFQSISPVRS